MATTRSIELTPQLADAIAAAAAFRGLSPEQYVLQVVTVASQLDAELASDIKEGEDDIAAGRTYSQEEVEAMFDVRREQRRAA